MLPIFRLLLQLGESMQLLWVPSATRL